MLDAFNTNGSSPPVRRYRLSCGRPAQASPRKLDGPAAVSQLALDLGRSADDGREHFWAVLLNAQLGYLMHTEVSVGTLNASLVLIHNHPSGDPTPSREDVRLTRQLVDAGKLLDIPVHDHVIVGNGTGIWVSFAKRGLL